MVGWVFLAATLVGLWFTLQAWRPVPLPKRRAIPSFFAGWLTNELAPHHLAWQLVATVLFARAGALATIPGLVGLAVAVGQWVALVLLIRDALRASEVVEQAVVAALGDGYRDDLPEHDEDWDRLHRGRLIIPFRVRHRDVRVRRNLPYGRVGATELRLDIVEPRSSAPRRPALIYVHGGAWVLGFRDRQGGPLLTEMAARGWVGIRPGYRLSPTATFPEHLVDVKRAIAWVREHADELGVDPAFIAIAGGSAGGHLAALAALTANDPDLQPGFEEMDTSVQACVPIYGVYDVDTSPNQNELAELISRYVMKADPHEDPHRWRQFRPIAQVRADAPPFLIVHGARDTFTSPREARTFAAELAAVSQAPVAYAELPGAQHAFDVFPSLRSAHAVRGIARFLATVHARVSATSPHR